MDKSIHLNLSQISLGNNNVFKKLINNYNDNDFGLAEYLEIVKKIDLKNLISDYQILLHDIKINIDSFNIGKNIYQTINRAIKSESYKNIYNIIAPELGENKLSANSYITTKLMELNNIYRSIQLLNTMPGTDGKPVNCIKLPDFQ